MLADVDPGQGHEPNSPMGVCKAQRVVVARAADRVTGCRIHGSIGIGEVPDRGTDKLADTPALLS